MTNQSPQSSAAGDGQERVVKRAGGWFVTGTEWSGPWPSREAAELASDGEYTLAHMEYRNASK